jgi:hypothetical protein
VTLEGDATSFGSPVPQKRRKRIALAALPQKSLPAFFQDGSLSIGPALAVRFAGLNPIVPKPAFAFLDRVSLAPTADSWAVRPGPAVSVVLAGSAGFQVSAPTPASADRYVVDCDFLDLTFSILLCWFFSVIGKGCDNTATPDLGINRNSSRDSCDQNGYFRSRTRRVNRDRAPSTNRLHRARTQSRQ